jgi:hypothetical protein
MKRNQSDQERPSILVRFPPAIQYMLQGSRCGHLKIIKYVEIITEKLNFKIRNHGMGNAISPKQNACLIMQREAL